MSRPIYNRKFTCNHSSIDIENIVRQSEVEFGRYELKQGLLRLDNSFSQDADVVEKILKTICAIANNGPKSAGTILIGVTDKESDARRIRELYSFEPRKVGHRWIAGVNREATKLGITPEAYFTRWKQAIKESDLSDDLKNDVLSSMDFNAFYGLGVLVISVPPQKQASYLGDDLYWRSGDSTKKAKSAKEIGSIVQRF